MKTLHIDTEPTWRGGEQQLLYLVEGLAARGFPTAVLAQPGSPMEARAREAGLDVRAFTIKSEADIRAAWRLARLLRDEQPRFDIVHTHTSHAHTVALTARFLLPRAIAPKLVVARRVDFSIYRHSFLGQNGLKYKGLDRIVAVSDCVRDVLARDGVDARGISVVRDGIDVERIERAPDQRDAARKSLGLRAGERLVLNVAHMAGHKGQRYLVAAVPEIRKRRPDARVAIVGDGGLRADLEAQARALGLGDALLMPGFRPPDEIPTLLKAADVFAFPSVEEGLGSSLFDAMAAGAPIVASRAGGIPEIVKDGETGLLVPPRDPEALAAAIARVLDDGDLARRLSAAASMYVHTYGTKERMVEETIAVYEALFSTPTPGRASSA